MQYAVEYPPTLIDPLNNLSNHIYGLTHYSNNLGLDGTLPLGQDFAGQLSSAAEQMTYGLTRFQRRSIENWAANWEAVQGQIGQLAVHTTSRKADVLHIAAPKDGITDAVPTLRYKVRYMRNSPGHQPFSIDIHAGYSRSDTSRMLDAVDLSLSAVDLMRLESNDPTGVPNTHIALSGLARQTSKIALAGQDPLKAAAPQIYHNVTTSQNGAGIQWAESAQKRMKVGTIAVDPVRYGPNRYIAVMHHGELGDKSPALLYTNDEWVAFIGGVKDNEFDL